MGKKGRRASPDIRVKSAEGIFDVLLINETVEVLKMSSSMSLEAGRLMTSVSDCGLSGEIIRSV